MLSEDFNLVGISSCEHKEYKNMAVFVYTSAFEMNELAIDKVEELMAPPPQKNLSAEAKPELKLGATSLVYSFIGLGFLLLAI